MKSPCMWCLKIHKQKQLDCPAMNKKKTVKKKRKFTVYIPCHYSEIYQGVEAESPAEALRMVRDGEAQCHGETSSTVDAPLVVPERS